MYMVTRGHLITIQIFPGGKQPEGGQGKGHWGQHRPFLSSGAAYAQSLKMYSKKIIH